MASEAFRLGEQGAPADRPQILVLATGGTIAGAAAQASDNVGYSAAQRSVRELLTAVPGLESSRLLAEQFAQLDSKDMGLSVWWRLTARIEAALADPAIRGIVVTHGTDTLEETGYWLARTLDATKPVVLTAAMRPASSLQADGPQNLVDAVRLAGLTGVRGVVSVMGGQILAAHELRKVHNYRIDAFSAGDNGPLGWLTEGQLRQLRPWPTVARWSGSVAEENEPAWPWVEVVTSHAGADGRLVDLLVNQGVQGLAVACTGNGSVHRDLSAALERAQHAGVLILRSTRCVLGQLVPDGGPLEMAPGLTPGQARVELILRLLAG
jgi:L-asparaginase